MTVPSTSLTESGQAIPEPSQRQHRVRSTGVVPSSLRATEQQANVYRLGSNHPGTGQVCQYLCSFKPVDAW